MRSLRVLITAWTLDMRGGSTLYVRDLALGLLAHGHQPIAYSPFPGGVGDELRAATVPVVEDLCSVGSVPDLIHGNHHPELVTALMHFPGVAALHFCHAWATWDAAPPRLPRIRRYVAVDDTCRDWLVGEQGIPLEQTCVHFNAVDLARFAPRPPLPSRPRRALVFSNYATEQLCLGAVREACARTGLELDVIGAGAGKPCVHPEKILGEYDLVFAKARCALEALAVGAAVVLCDALGMGPMVRSDNWQQLRPQNFGRRALRMPVEATALEAAIKQYDAADAAEVSRAVRDHCGLDRSIDAMLTLYEQILHEHAAAPPADPIEELRAMAAYLPVLTPRAKTAVDLEAECRRLAKTAEALTIERHHLTAELAQWQNRSAHLDEISAELHQERAACRQLQEQLADRQRRQLEMETRCSALEQQRGRLAADLENLTRSATVRVGSRLARVPILGKTLRLAARAGRRLTNKTTQ
jgi:hypothetical protein